MSWSIRISDLFANAITEKKHVKTEKFVCEETRYINDNRPSIPLKRKRNFPTFQQIMAKTMTDGLPKLIYRLHSPMLLFETAR